MRYDPLDARADPFRPPDIPTLVECLHCGQQYDSYRIEWRMRRDANEQLHGFWCCPISGCDGRGFGFDILPLDPDYRDERGGWFTDDDALGEQFTEGGASQRDEAPRDDNEALPW